MTALGQFFREVGQATRTPAMRAAVKQAFEQEVVKGLQRALDGFEASRSAPAKPARAPAASVAEDGQYVTRLYRDLLGRAPDVGGFNAHLTSLQGGLSREALRQAFLDSPEFKAKSAPVTPTAPAEPAPLTGRAQLEQLIRADVRTAYGRDATQSDFSYWLPKLEEPCDSGFVTSGQMTGTEYYHRRMLGWQAGGDDLATSGPYAGSPEARSPVPSAVDVVGPLR